MHRTAPGTAGAPATAGAELTAGAEGTARPGGTANPGGSAPPPTQRMMELVVGSWAARAVHAAVVLGIPERLAEGGPADSARLAEATGADASALRRLMDYLVALEVCAGGPEEGYRLTAYGEVLRPGVPGSVHSYVLLAGREFYAVWGELLHTLRTGEPAFDKVYGQDLYAYTTADPEAGQRFDEAMNSGRVLFGPLSRLELFAGARRVVDIGGGNGELLAEILHAHPGLHGVLYELPGPAATAPRYLDERGVGDRCEVAVGDMFEQVPGGADVYVLSRILVNWDDDRAARLLANCARALPSGAAVLVVERPQTESAPSPVAAAVDLLMMLVTHGGRSRTVARLHALFEGAGLVPEAVEDLPQGFRALVARRP